jgi:PAS domain S-box-containing protein
MKISTFLKVPVMVKRFGVAGSLLLLFFVASGMADPDYYDLLERASVVMKSGRSLEAERILTTIINAPNQEENLLLKGKAHRQMAFIFASHSRKAEEIEHLFKSYWFFLEAKELVEEAEAQRLIGQYYLQMKLPEEADRYLNNAFKISTALNDTAAQIKIMSNQGQLAFLRSSLDESMMLHEKAIFLSKKINSRQGLLENWNRIAYVYWQKGDLKKMLLSMKETLPYLTSNTDTLGIIYGDLGFAFLENGILDSANQHLQKALTSIQEGDNIQQEMLIYKQLYRLRVKQNDLKEAILFLEKYTTLRDQFFNEGLKNEVSYAEERYNELANSLLLKEAKIRGSKLVVILSFTLVLLVGLMFILVKLRKMNRYALQQRQELNFALQKLQKSEDIYKQLFESNMGLVITHTLEGIITSANKAVLKLFGIDKEKIIGRSLKDFIHPEYKHLFAVYLQEIINKKETAGLMTVLDKQGQKRILSYQNNIVVNEDGYPYVIGFSQDQTEFYKTQKLANQSAKRLSLIMEHSPDTYSVLDREGLISYINHSTVGSPEQIIGRNIFEFLEANQAIHFNKQIIAAFDGRKVVESEEEYGGKYFLTKLIPLIEGENVKNLLSINTDITVIKENETELRKLSSIVEQTANIVMITDAEGLITWVNLSFESITGYSKEEATGKNPSQLLQGPDTDEEVISYMQAQIKDQTQFECELLNYNKNGDRYWVKITAQPIFDSDGKFQGHFSIQQDITLEKQLTRQITLAKEEAEESNRLKTIFLGSLSHEVRTPLQGILGFAEILESPGIPEDKRKSYLTIIKRRTFDMQNIIESLLDMASLETGEIKAFPVKVNLKEFIETIFDKFKQEDKFGKLIELVLENKLPKDAMTTIDALHLNQVLVNLFRNAVKFTDQGSITLIGEVQQHFYLISIADTGIGIAPDKIDHIFKPFRQAHEGLSRSKGGIGLGLSICKKMVEIWGGTILVSSEPSKGSTFSFSIPIKHL